MENRLRHAGQHARVIIHIMPHLAKSREMQYCYGMPVEIWRDVQIPALRADWHCKTCRRRTPQTGNEVQPGRENAKHRMSQLIWLPKMPFKVPMASAIFPQSSRCSVTRENTKMNKCLTCHLLFSRRNADSRKTHNHMRAKLKHEPKLGSEPKHHWAWLTKIRMQFQN